MGRKAKGPKPLIKEWTLLFDSCDGYKNRDKIAKEFASFWNDPYRKSLSIPGRCRIGGEIYGIRGLVNGSEYVTSMVTKIVRLKVGKPRNNRFRRDLFRVETAIGKEFYLFGDSFSLCMLLMLGDAMDEVLEHKKDYYLHPKHARLGIYL